MEGKQDPSFDLEHRHYFPLTLRTADRDQVPDKKTLDPEWIVKCQDQPAPIWNLKTPSMLNFGLVSASFQGAVRQGRVLEALQWALEMVRTDAHYDDRHLQMGGARKVGKGETNFWTRAAVITCEDVALANPHALVVVAELIKNPQVKAPDKDLFLRLTVGVTYDGSKVKYYTNRRQWIWVAFLKVLQHLEAQGQRFPVVTAIVKGCYDLAHDDKFRWEIASRLFGRTAALAICLRVDVEKRGLEPKTWSPEEMPLRRNYTPEELEQLRLSAARDNLWFGVSDIAKDKHTAEGKRYGRGLQHFIELKAFLRHEDMSLSALSDYYLKLCFETRYEREYSGGFFDHSGGTTAQYLEWLPALRHQHNLLNQIEDLLVKQTMTITFCEAAENHVGMEQLGKMAEAGFTVAELLQIGQNFLRGGFKVEYYDLRQALTAVAQADGSILNRSGEAEEAGVLVLRNVGNLFVDKIKTNVRLVDGLPRADVLLLELLDLNWDKKAFMKGRVVNKKARHNLVFADFSRGPNYEQKEGTIVDFKQVPYLQSVRAKLEGCFGAKAHNLLAEGNHYYDASSCYIGYHGDSERRVVIGLRLGSSMNLSYQWHQDSNKVGSEILFVLNHGDMYIMSQKAVGTDWKKKKIFTLRHGANVHLAK